MEIASEILPKYVTSFNGLNTEDGDAIPFDVVCEEVYFMELTSKFVNKLFEISNMGAEKETKNLDGQQGTPITE